MLQPSCDLIVQSKLAKDINYRLKSINLGNKLENIGSMY